MRRTVPGATPRWCANIRFGNATRSPFADSRNHTGENTMPKVPAESESLSRPDGSDSLRVQILATEHWSLLATRSMTWNEPFARASMFITVISAAIVVLELVVQA